METGEVNLCGSRLEVKSLKVESESSRVPMPSSLE